MPSKKKRGCRYVNFDQNAQHPTSRQTSRIDGRSWVEVVRGKSISPSLFCASSRKKNELIEKHCVHKDFIQTLSKERHVYPTDADIRDSFLKSTFTNFEAFVKLLITARLFLRGFYKDGSSCMNSMNSFCKMSTNLAFFTKALIAVDSILLGDFSRIFATVYFITLKAESQLFRFSDVFETQKKFCEFADIPLDHMTKKNIIDAERMCFEASHFSLPLASSFDILCVLFKRLSIFTDHFDKSVFDKAFVSAKELVLTDILSGNDCGYQTARGIFEKSLSHVGACQNIDVVFGSVDNSP